MGVTFTFDLEDHRERPGDEARHVRATRDVVEFLAERQVRGTFFVVRGHARAVPGRRP